MTQKVWLWLTLCLGLILSLGFNVASLGQVSKPVVEQNPVLDDSHREQHRQDFGNEDYADPISASITGREPSSDEKTFIVLSRPSLGGLRNQMQMFMAIVLMAMREANCTQILLPSIYWNDVHGSEMLIPHEQLFDVDHWNSYYPRLPKLVDYDPQVFPGYNLKSGRFNARIQNKKKDTAKVAGYQGSHKMLFAKYFEKYSILAERDPADILVRTEALRPHKDLRAIVEQQLQLLKRPFMALHTRIEPDMQVHTPCENKKVRSLAIILDMLYTKFPTPPKGVQTVLFPVHRPSLQAVEGTNNTLGLENLESFRKLQSRGLWNGTVPIVQAGTDALQESRFFYQLCPALCGALINLELAYQSAVVVGTPVSSWAVDLVIDRHLRNEKSKDYYFLPEEGIIPAVDHYPIGKEHAYKKKTRNLEEPQPFNC